MNHLEHLTQSEQQAVVEIKRAVSNLAGSKLKGFYLFGSKARGDYDPESDVDMAILIEGLDRNLKDKILGIVADIETERLVMVSALVLSWKDFTDLRNRERRIALDIEREGIAV